MTQAALKEQPELDFSQIIEEGRQKLIKGAKWKQNTTILFIKANGELGVVDNHVCHAVLRNGAYSKFVINGLNSGESYNANSGRYLPPETEHWFVDYILNRSPYQEIFIEKDAKKALETRTTIASTELPANIVAAGLVALRRLWEYNSVARTAHDLVLAGVNEDLAFYLGHCMQIEDHIKPDSTASWTACKAGHCSLDPACMGFKELKNFLKHKPKKLNDKMSSGARYGGYDGMYGECYDNNVQKYVRHNFPVHLYKDAPVVASTNPFQAAKKALDPVAAGKDTAPYAKAIEVMAEWAKTHLMEKINNA